MKVGLRFSRAERNGAEPDYSDNAHVQYAYNHTKVQVYTIYNIYTNMYKDVVLLILVFME